MRTSLTLLLSLSLAACGGGGGDDSSDGTEESTSTETSDEGWTTGDDGQVDLFEIEVSVNYEGTAPGGLTVGAFVSCPPELPPVSFQRVSEPTYPLDVTLIDVENGTYCVYAYIDEAPENPTFPGDEDPQGYSEGFVVDGANAQAQITILDPSP